MEAGDFVSLLHPRKHPKSTSNPISVWSPQVLSGRPLCVNIEIARSIEVSECGFVCMYKDS